MLLTFMWSHRCVHSCLARQVCDHLSGAVEAETGYVLVGGWSVLSGRGRSKGCGGGREGVVDLTRPFTVEGTFFSSGTVGDRQQT